MNLTERSALLVLLRAGRRWSDVADEVADRGSALALLRDQPAAQQLPLLAVADSPDDFEPRLTEAERDIAGWEREGMRFVTVLDPEYPPQLLAIHQRPPFVMWRGRPDPRDATGVAIVGTRQATTEGIRTAATLAGALAARGVPVISGLAAGIDAAAHRGALDAGGRTVAVVGTGLRRAYPKPNADLQQRIARDGLVLSQFLPDAPPTRSSFAMRNAVMSGYAAATVVVEAGWRSGARMQARLALEHGRPVLLLRSLLEHDWARACAERPGTAIVDGVDDVMEQLSAITDEIGELVWA